jgi:hypothetical protein
MEKITVLNLLKAFKDLVEKDKIQFLKRDPRHGKKEVLKPLNELLNQFEKADAQKKTGKGLSEALDWHEAHKTGRELWEQLISAALNDIHREPKGNSQIFEYSKAATEFEELLYGLEGHYRDHTLHSLWVYLLGEHILRDLIPDIHADLNWYLYNDVEKDKTEYSRKLMDDARKKEKDLCKKVSERRDAIWCIMALCHDLGYSLEKLGKLNEKVRNVLKFVDLPDFQQVGYTLNIEHQFHVAQFLELMAMEPHLVPSEDLKTVLIKGYRDDSTYWRLCRAFEKKQHGILSAYLVYKILHVFAEAWMRGPAEDWGLEDGEALDNIIRGDILFAIAQHEFDFAYLNQLHSLADILVLADELEEFSRYGRPMLSRKYHDTTADVSVSFKRTKGRHGEDVDIDIVYHVAEYMGPKQFHEFFVRKAQKLCKIYSLDEEREGKYCTIRSIKMTAKYGEKNLIFVRSINRVYKAYLPAANIDHKAYKEGERSLTCLDDRLYIDIAEKRITIDDWFKNAQ